MDQQQVSFWRARRASAHRAPKAPGGKLKALMATMEEKTNPSPVYHQQRRSEA